MPKSLLKAAVFGGLVAFLWGVISWMVLPFHQHCLHKFANESKVACVIADNAPEKGMYVLPYTFHYNENSSQEAMQRAVDMMENGPFVFAAVVPHGLGSKMAGPMVLALVIQIVAAFIVSWMLLQTRGLTLQYKIVFVTLFGLGAGILCLLPAWNWVGFSGAYVFLGIVDLVIAWALAGFVIAKTLKISNR